MRTRSSPRFTRSARTPRCVEGCTPIPPTKSAPGSLSSAGPRGEITTLNRIAIITTLNRIIIITINRIAIITINRIAITTINRIATKYAQSAY